MSRAIFKIWRRPNISISPFSAIAASSRPSSSSSSSPICISEQPASPSPMTTEHRSLLFTLEPESESESESESIASSEHLSSVNSTKNADDVVRFLINSASLSETQLGTAVRLRPSILLSSVPSALRPDLDAFRSILPGPCAPYSTLASLVTACAASFGHSPARIIPAIPLLHHLLLRRPPKVGSALLRCPDLLAHHPDDVISRNADLLRARGLGDPVKLADFIGKAPVALILSPSDLELAFSTVQRELGLTMGDDGGDDDDCINSVALAATLSHEGGGFTKKIELLRRFGFKDEDTMMLFRMKPCFMRRHPVDMCSRLEFFRDRVGFGPGEMINFALLHLKALREKEWITAEVDMSRAFLMSREEFEKEFVYKVMKVAGRSLVRNYLKSVYDESCNSCEEEEEAPYKLFDKAKGGPPA